MELQQNHIFINLKVEIYKYQVVDNTGFKISVIYRNQDKLKFTSLNALKMSLRVYNLNFWCTYIILFLSQNHKIDVNMLSLTGLIKLKI